MILSPIFIGTLFIFDRILLSIFLKNVEGSRDFAKQLFNIKKDKVINGKNIFSEFKEGSLLTKARKRFAHHDELNDFAVLGKGSEKLWIFGDSWGEGIMEENKLNNTIANDLNKDFGTIRFIANGSWSPLLFHIAYQNRIKYYNESPDIVVF